MKTIPAAGGGDVLGVPDERREPGGDRRAAGRRRAGRHGRASGRRCWWPRRSRSSAPSCSSSRRRRSARARRVAPSPPHPSPPPHPTAPEPPQEDDRGHPNPQLLADAPVEVLESRTLFRVGRRSGAAAAAQPAPPRDRPPAAGVPDRAPGPEHVNDGAVMLTHSDDDGATWDEPFPIYAVPGLGFAAAGRHRAHPRRPAAAGRRARPVRRRPSAATSRSPAGSCGDHGVARRRPVVVARSATRSASGPSGRSSTGRRIRTAGPTGELIWAVMGTLGRDMRVAGRRHGHGTARAATTSRRRLIAADPAKNFADTDLHPRRRRPRSSP